MGSFAGLMNLLPVLGVHALLRVGTCDTLMSTSNSRLVNIYVYCCIKTCTSYHFVVTFANLFVFHSPVF